MRKVSCGKLFNGMRFYTQYESSGVTNLFGIGIKAGSIHDPESARGTAHVAEHVLFRATPHGMDEEYVNRFVYEYMGGFDGLNVHITKTATFFGSCDLYSRKDLKAFFDLIVGLIKDHSITRDGASVEKAAVHQEYYLMGNDIPSETIDSLFYKTLYTMNPVRYSIDGDVDHIRECTAERVRSFVRRYYVPKNMFIVALGPSFVETRETCERVFENWGPTTVPQFHYDHSDDSPVLRAVVSHEAERVGIHQYHLAIGFPTETYLSRDAEALDVLAKILSMRLFMRLREKNRDFDKGTYRAPVVAERSFVHGVFYAKLATTSRDFVQTMEDVFVRECAALKEHIDEQDMKACVGGIVRWYKDAFRDSAETLADLIIRAVSNGDDELIRLHDYKDRVAKLTRRRLQSVARKYFTKNYVRALLKPA